MRDVWQRSVQLRATGPRGARERASGPRGARERASRVRQHQRRRRRRHTGMVQTMARRDGDDTHDDDQDNRIEDAGETADRDGRSGRTDDGRRSDAGPETAPPTTADTVRSLTFDQPAPAPAAPAGAVPSPGPIRPSGRGGARPGAGRKPSGKAAAEPKAKPARTASTAAPRLTPDTQAAGALLALTEGGLVAFVGGHAQMTDYERSMIEPPLGRMLARMAPESVARFSAFADPIALLIGVGMYTARVLAHNRNAPAGGSARRPERPTTAAPMAPAPSSGAAVVVPNQPSAAAGVPHVNGALTRDDIEIAREFQGV